MKKTSLKIDGMSCGHCVAAVKKALEGVQGVAVENVAVGTAVVGYDPAQVSREQVIRAVEDAGYTAVAAD